MSESYHLLLHDVQRDEVLRDVIAWLEARVRGETPCVANRASLASCAMRRIVRWFLVLALSLSIGLQWAVVQGVAWVGMIVSYSKEATRSRSLSMTFDGRHPCKWCHAAQEGDSTQKKQDSERRQDKLVMAAPETEPFVFARCVPSGEPDGTWAMVWRPQPPPSPPPKAV